MGTLGQARGGYVLEDTCPKLKRRRGRIYPIIEAISRNMRTDKNQNVLVNLGENIFERGNKKWLGASDWSL